MDIDLILKAYNVPSDLSSMIIPLEKAKENALISEEEIMENQELSNMVHGYDALFPIGLTKDYVEKRDFNHTISLKELLQNALDEQELVIGKPEIQIDKDELGIWIKDNGRGINIKALRMGGSDKECWMRGYYGEGLKLASSFFILQDTPVYYFTKNIIYKFITLPLNSSNPGIYVLMGRTSLNITGTHILLYKYREELDNIKKLIRFSNEELKEKLIFEESYPSENCPKKEPNAIFDYPDLLYIRNMYVGKTSEVTKRESLLSYDLWWVKLDVSRKIMTQSAPLIFREVSKLLERSASAREIYANKLIKSGMLKTKQTSKGEIIEFEPIFSIFEGHLFVYSFPKGMFETFIDVLGFSDKQSLIRKVSTDEEAYKTIDEGFIPFKIQYETFE